MSKYDKRKKEKRGNQRDSYILVGILTYIVILIFRIPLIHLIGEKGVAYFGMAYEFFLILTFFFSYGMTESVASMVRYRIKREQYRNASKVLRCALIMSCVIGVGISTIVFFTASIISEKIIRMPLCSMVIGMMAPAFFFYMLTAVFRGYFQGNGSKVPAMHSKILEVIFMILGGSIGAVTMYDYGQKVSALLMNADYACVYGAVGASIGILVASVFCFLHMLALFFIYRRNSKRNDYRDLQKYPERQSHIMHMLVGTALPYALFGLLFHSLTFVSGCIYMHMSVGVSNTVLQWGNYYGKFFPIVGTVGALLSILSIEPVKAFVFFAERDEYRTLRERMNFFIHQCVIWTVPAAVFTAVLSENVLSLFFKGNHAVIAQYIMWGCVGIIFYVLAITFSNIMIRQRKIRFLIVSGMAAYVVNVLATIFIMKKTNLGIVAPIIGNVLFYVILTAIGFVYVVRKYQYSQEWIRSVAFPLVCAGIAGLIVMLLDKAFAPMVGDVISLVICLPIGIIAYILFLLAIRSLTERDLENMFMGKMLIKVARTFHFM